MVRKKDLRELRKIAQAEKDKAKSARLVEAFQTQNKSFLPTVTHFSEEQKLPVADFRITPGEEDRSPRAQQTGSRFDLPMTWCARKGDCADAWTWGEARQWSADEWRDPINDRLNASQGELWKDLQNQAAGGHKLNHDHDIFDLCPEAVERWIAIGLEEFDTPFRFRLGNLRRAWGVVVGAHFYMVWYERGHKIYEVNTD